MAEQDSLPEVIEVPHSVADALEHLRFVIAALDVSVRPGHIHGVENLLKPIPASSGAILKLLYIRGFRSQQPLFQSRSSYF